MGWIYWAILIGVWLAGCMLYSQYVWLMSETDNEPPLTGWMGYAVNAAWPIVMLVVYVLARREMRLERKRQRSRANHPSLWHHYEGDGE